MKVLKYILVLFIALVVFYVGAILLGFNLPKPASLDKGIEGNAELRVTLLMDNNLKNPLPNIEVDVAEKLGQPLKGGVAITNEQGVATFKVKPGSYYIFFNSGAFPKNLAEPEPQQVTVSEGGTNEKTILVNTSR